MKKKENSTTLRRGEGCCHRAASNVVVVAGNVEKFNCVCLHINVSWCKVVENKQSWTYQTVFNNVIASDTTTVDATLMLHDDNNPLLAGEWLNFPFFSLAMTMISLICNPLSRWVFCYFLFFFHINFIAIQTAGCFEPPLPIFCLHHPSSASTARLLPPPPVFCLHRSVFCLHRSFSASTAHFLPPPPVFCLRCPLSASTACFFCLHLSSLSPIFRPYACFNITDPFSGFFGPRQYFCTYYQLYYCFVVLEIWLIPINNPFSFTKKTLILNNKFKSGVPPKLRSAGAEYKLNDG